MRTNYLLTTLLVFFFQLSIAQVGIGTTLPDPSSELDVSSPLNDKGVLIPRMTQAQRNLIATPATSLLIYQTDNTPGFYYYNGTVWVGITAGASTDWTLLGNAGTAPATNFFGTTDNNDIVFRRNNIRAGFIGNPNTSTGNRNTSFGANTLLTPSATGIRNVAIGTNVLTTSSTGNLNVAIGESSMFSNTTGNNNTAVGAGSLFSSLLGVANTAIGRQALTALNGISGSQGSNNTAVGYEAIRNSQTGQQNTAVGREALRNNLVGDSNVAIGYQSGKDNTGSKNITIGSGSEVPVLANSDQLSIGNVIYGTTMTSTAAGKIGIGESNPNAKLQITSSSQASPAITDGVIIPKVDNLAATPTAAQEGMLVYLNAISGTNQPGFYYWDNDIPSWVGLNSTVNGDHDWYKVGTTTAPTAITDDMFHTGKVAIGKITASSTLDVETVDDYEGIKNSTNKIGGSAFIDAIGINNTIDAQFSRRLGIQNNLNGSVGNTSNKIGVQNNISNDGNEKIGVQNNITTSVTSTTTTHKGVFNSIINSNNTSGASVYGVENFINNNSINGPSFGSYNAVTSGATAGTGGNYGVFNTISGYKLGGKFGVQNTVTSDVEDSLYGVYNLITSSATDGNPLTNGNTTGVENSITLNNDAITSGNYNYINGTGHGNVNGVFSSIANSGNGDHIGILSILNGSGTGKKYGTSTTINTTAGGTHYGVYSEVLKAGATNFAGYFLGNVGIGTTNLNTYTLPASRATSAGQIMQSNATGVVTWQTPAAALNSSVWLTSGNTSVAADFLGTNNAFPLRFVTSGTERMRIVPTGEVVIGSTTIVTGDRFSSYTTGSQISVHGYSTLTGRGVQGENTGTGIAVYGINSGTGRGVEGDSAGVGIGVIGFNTGAGVGVQGQNSSTGVGVFGSSTGTGAGVQGQNNTSGGTAIAGINNAPSGTGSGNGIFGRTSQRDGIGVYGYNSNTTGGTSFGYGFGVSRVSVFGDGLDAGSYSFGILGDGGTSTRSGGVFGDNYGFSRGALGYFNSGSVDYAVYGFGLAYQTGAAGGRPGSAIVADQPNNMVGLGIYGGVMGGWVRGMNYGFHAKGKEYGMYVDGNTITNKPVVQLIENGKEKRSVSYSTTSMSVDVYTRGTSALVNGTTYISLKEDFSSITSKEIPLNITVTPTGASKGVYVTDISNEGFRIVENGDGRSNVSVNWVAYGTRIGYENPEEIVSEEILSSKFDENMDAVMYNDNNTDGQQKGIWFDGNKVQTGRTPDSFQQAKLAKGQNKKRPSIEVVKPQEQK
ncbi:MAG: hypothetical protein O9267_05885 [Flavobacterium sp.]|uniref:beta strand repeat-containing protein n=1 Tax=Flavobacterium sp. TaxID=239 RepID=UPI0022C706BF|nr:hypothetical protein [Flavobacterium sp.]MCZ8197116.1 hypothetical protein [Flavobacterium sp.]